MFLFKIILLKPLKKNFDMLMDENKSLREEFQVIHEKNEKVKKANKDLLRRQKDGEKKIKDLQKELVQLTSKFAPAASGRLDFQQGMNEMLKMIQEQCDDDKLVDCDDLL